MSGIIATGRPGSPSMNGMMSRPNPVEWHQPFAYAGDDHAVDRMGWPVDHLGTPVFDWADGDGLNPHVGPALTAAGSPTAGVATPWVGHGGEDVTATEFDGADGYSDSAQFDPASGQDVRVLALVRPIDDRASANYRVFSNRNAGSGFTVYWRTDNPRIICYFNNGSSASSVSLDVPSGWMLIDYYLDLDGNHTLKINGASNANASPGGDHGSGSGLGLGMMPNGTDQFIGDIARVMVWFGGSELSNASDHASLLASVLGVQNVQRNGVATFARASSAVKAVGSRYHVFSSGSPRSGNTDGLLVEAAGTNKVYNTINPQATTGWSTGGGTLTVVDDSAALEAAGLREVGPNVFEASTGGSAAVMRCGAVTGNTNPHSLSVFARTIAGGPAEIGFRDASSGAWTKVGDISDSYTRTTFDNQTPSDTDELLAIRIPVGCTIRFTLPQMEESPICTSPIPNVATAATATRATDVLDTTHTPRDAEGAVEAGLTPVGWSGADLASARVVTRATASRLVRYNGGGYWDAYDGTTITSVPAIAPADGVRNLVRTRWGDGGWRIDVDGTRDPQNYDGAIEGAGVIRLSPDSQCPLLVDSFCIYRSESG